MDDRLAWLRAQINEDERVARAGGDAMGLDDPSFPDYRTYDGPDIDAACAYLTHFSPARVLRRVEADRKLLDLAVALTETEGSDPASNLLMRQAGEDIIDRLAASYADGNT